jgi:hypothetical protein
LRFLDDAGRNFIPAAPAAFAPIFEAPVRTG